MKTVKIVYLGSLFLVATLVITLIISASTGNLKHPEQLITGTWKEVSWQYDKKDNANDSTVDVPKVLDEQMKESISEGLHIHQSETWTFDKNTNLILEKKNEKPTLLNWRMKGRGHILKLHYDNESKEYYQIRELTKDRLVLNFENNTHARGIVEIVLEKVK